jgi:hypothetical protein
MRILLAFALALCATAQTTSLSGRIVDSTLASITTATVEVRNLATETTQTLKTNSDGFFLLPALNPGAYSITAQATGFATALLMRTLGVKDEAIYEDYLLVNQLVPADQNAKMAAERFRAVAGRDIDPDQLKPLMGTRREWLANAFATINEKHGNFDNYRRKELNLSDKDVKELRQLLLQ